MSEARAGWRADGLAASEVAERTRDMIAETCDLSASGFSFICDHFIHTDTVLYTRFESLPDRPIVKAVVRHCVYLSARQHSVGVEFVEPAPGEQMPTL